MYKYLCLIVCLTFVDLGAALKCYNCQSSPTNDCTDVKKLTMAICTPVRDAYPPVCIRKVLSSALGQNITLQCVNQQTMLECDPPQNYSVVACNMCQEDLCNNQNQMGANLALIAFPSLVGIYLGVKQFQ